jgi:hypothetical protein
MRDPLQTAKELTGDILQVLAALTQIVVIDRREPATQLECHLVHRPFCVHVIVDDLLLDRFDERAVREQQGVGLEERRQLFAVHPVDTRLVALDLRQGLASRGPEALDLGRHVLVADRDPEDLDIATRDHHRAPDRDPL